jgi:hypothetical protein
MTVKPVKDMTIPELLKESAELNARIAKSTLQPRYYKDKPKNRLTRQEQMIENLIKLYR